MATSWTKLRASEVAKRTSNRIRDIIQTLDLKPPTTKMIIPLSVADPTLFGNLRVPSFIYRRIARNVEGIKYNGYEHSCGMAEARAAVAEAVGRQHLLHGGR
eukprot:GHVU01071502.1.p5 GENE.GHVU01071502.1~~GHVU01071502.1.p5  ORF type:complete len:102 (+),score=11.67 GHVU01071502.1:94-399(+)